MNAHHNYILWHIADKESCTQAFILSTGAYDFHEVGCQNSSKSDTTLSLSLGGSSRFYVLKAQLCFAKLWEPTHLANPQATNVAGIGTSQNTIGARL